MSSFCSCENAMLLTCYFLSCSNASTSIYFRDCWELVKVWSCVQYLQQTSIQCPAYRSSGSPSRPWRHSGGLHPATAVASWCRSPAEAPASSPSPAWSHCHSQSSFLMSPPRNGPHHMGLHSGHDAWGGGRQTEESDGSVDTSQPTSTFMNQRRWKLTFFSHLKDIQMGDKLKE